MRRIIALIAAMMLICAAALADEVVRGDSGDAVTRLQERLTELGFLEGKIDGKYGPATSAAVLDLKRVLNARYGLMLAEDGDAADAVTTGYLYAADTEFFAGRLSAGDSGSEVLRLQRVLCLAGYLDGGGKTGEYGESTARAVRAFQKANGLTVSGDADEAAQILLYSDRRKDSPYEFLLYGASGDAVTAMQESLWRLGYLEKEPDGKYGPGTREALILFMEDEMGNEAASGDCADIWTQMCLKEGKFTYERTYGVNDEDRNVARIARLLARYGYYDGGIGSALTGDMQIALQYFQQTNRLPVTGTADRDTQELLFSGRAAQVDTPAPRTLQVGDSGSTVLEFQNQLVRVGFLTAPVDGKFGPDTEAAANALLYYLVKRGNAQASDWEAGDARLQMLLRGGESMVPEKMSVGATGIEIERVQRRLNSLGYLSRLYVDGKYGERTQTAIRLFQETNGLNATGNGDRRTLAALFSADAVERLTQWRLNVSIEDQRVYVYQLGSDSTYSLYATFVCSTGLNNATPRGVFCGTTGAGARWHHFEDFDCWAQYAYFIEHDIMFHSVIYSRQDESSLRQSSVRALGYPASHGCVRLSVENAEWIYTTCPAGTVVTIY